MPDDITPRVQTAFDLVENARAKLEAALDAFDAITMDSLGDREAVDDAEDYAVRLSDMLQEWRWAVERHDTRRTRPAYLDDAGRRPSEAALAVMRGE